MSIARYNKSNTKTLATNELRKSGATVFQSMIPVKILPEDDDAIITANAGDRLDALASKFYGSSVLWFVIASVNNLENGEMHIKPGTQLRIPSIHRIIG